MERGRRGRRGIADGSWRQFVSLVSLRAWGKGMKGGGVYGALEELFRGLGIVGGDISS